MAIKVRLQSIDGVNKVRTFHHIDAARRFAVAYVGNCHSREDCNGSYVVSNDGICKIACEGISLGDLFNAPKSEELVPLWQDDYKSNEVLYAPISMCEKIVIDADSDEYGTHLHYGYVLKTVAEENRRIVAQMGNDDIPF